VVRRLVEAHQSSRTAGVLGETTVNVLSLNLALDRLGR
jgi:K+-transporting ATPase c subunit